MRMTKFVVDRFISYGKGVLEERGHLNLGRKNKEYRKSEKRRGNYFFAGQAKKRVGREKEDLMV